MGEYRHYFGTPDVFTQPNNVVYRLYTILPGFSTDAAGLYNFMLSLRNTAEHNKGTSQYHRVWMSKKRMELQSGLGRRAFQKRLDTLIDYGLVTEYPSQTVPKGKEYTVHDPLTYQQFADKYPDEVRAFVEEVDEMERLNAKNRTQRNERIQKKAAVEDKLQEAAATSEGSGEAEEIDWSKEF